MMNFRDDSIEIDIYDGENRGSSHDVTAYTTLSYPRFFIDDAGPRLYLMTLGTPFILDAVGAPSLFDDAEIAVFAWLGRVRGAVRIAEGERAYTQEAVGQPPFFHALLHLGIGDHLVDTVDPA